MLLPSIRNPGVLLVPALALVLTACGGTQATATPSTAAPSASVPADLSPEDQLDAALAPFADGYDFVSEVTLGDVAATHGAGRRVGQDSETLVGTGEGRVTVRTVGSDAWTQKPGEDWVAVEEPTEATDQIAILRAPETVSATEPIDGVPSLIATYPPGALGLNGADVGSVIVQIHPDGSVEVTYEVQLQAGSAVSHTLFSDLTDPTPIVAPS